MARYLIDVNLPYYFSLWNGDQFVHQHDLGDSWTDDQIWSQTETHDLVIVTKDADFSERALFHTPPPRVIHIRCGNLKMKEFSALLTRLWFEAAELAGENRLVTTYSDRVEAIK